MFTTTLREESAEVYEWDKNEETALPTNILVTAYDPVVAEDVLGLAIAPRVVNGTNSVTTIYCDVTWSPALSLRTVSIEIQSQEVGSAVWTEESVGFDPVAGKFTFGAGVNGAGVTVQARYHMSNGAVGDWATATVGSTPISTVNQWSAVFDNGDGTKPADGATNTSLPATAFGNTGQTVGGVTVSINTNAQSIIEQALRQDDAQTVLDARTYISGQPIATLFQSFTNTQTTINSALQSSLTLLGAQTSDGSAWSIDLNSVQVSPTQTLAEKFNEIGVNTGAVVASVSTLNNVIIGPSGAPTARAIVTLDVNGYVSGVTQTNNGSASDFAIVADRFSITDSSGAAPFTPFSIANDVVSMHTVEIDTLKINTAVIPSRAAASAPIAGSFTSTTDAPNTGQAVLTCSITMPVAGYIEATAAVKQAFNGSIDGKTPWRIEIQVAGSTLVESLTGGTVPGDSVISQGSLYVAAGTYTVTLNWAAHTSISIDGRSLFVKGFP